MHCIEVYTKNNLQNYFTNEQFGSYVEGERDFPFHFHFPSRQTSEPKYQTQAFIKIPLLSSPSPTIKQIAKPTYK